MDSLVKLYVQSQVSCEVLGQSLKLLFRPAGFHNLEKIPAEPWSQLGTTHEDGTPQEAFVLF